MGQYVAGLEARRPCNTLRGDGTLTSYRYVHILMILLIYTADKAAVLKILKVFSTRRENSRPGLKPRSA
jgi:hypothetical protein